MSELNGEVRSFFSEYESANADFDLAAIGACYGDVFMFGGPGGVQCVKKEDFLKVLPRRKEFFRSVGLVSSAVESVEASAMDSLYTLARVVWKMKFEVGGEIRLSENAASYVLMRREGGFQIVFQVDHQDLRARVAELGLG